MIGRYVDLEQQRLARKGYKTVVSSVSVTITEACQQIQLMNDSYILTGVRVNRPNQLSEVDNVILCSPTDCLQISQHELPMLGTGILRKFRNYLTVKTFGQGGFDSKAKITPYRLEFIKITPIADITTTKQQPLATQVKGW